MRPTRRVYFPQGQLFELDVKLAGGEIWLGGVVYSTNELGHPIFYEAIGAALMRIEATGTAESDHRLVELSRSLCEVRSHHTIPLFCGDHLLVFDRSHRDGRWDVLEFGTGGGRLQPRRVIRGGDPQVGRSRESCDDPQWCASKDTLYAWNLEPKTLTTYSIL